MDPHKRSVTIEVMAPDETVLDGGRFATDAGGCAAMLRAARRWPERVWAVEGCSGIGRHVATRLLADDEQVVDVPPKLSARVRVFSTGQGRKTDATDAHSVALVGTRMAGLRPVVDDQQLAVLRVLADRRRALGEDHTRMVAQLHHLLLELIPGGAKKDLSAAQAKGLLAKVRPRDAAGKTRRRVAAELIADLERIYARKKAADKELRELVTATGTSLMTLNGIGPSGAARLLIDVGDITRSRPRGTSRRGTAPPRSTRPPATEPATACHAPATGRSTGLCTSWPPSSYGTRARDAPTTTGRRCPARRPWRRCAASSAGCPTSSTATWSTTPSAR
jgi:transposase